MTAAVASQHEHIALARFPTIDPRRASQPHGTANTGHGAFLSYSTTANKTREQDIREQNEAPTIRIPLSRPAVPQPICHGWLEVLDNPEVRASFFAGRRVNKELSRHKK